MNKITTEERRLIRIAECGTDEESKEAFKQLKYLNSTYHFCDEWDGMVICDKSSEWDCCLCFK